MDGDRLVIHASTQVMALTPPGRAPRGHEHKVHVIKERVGGGFGSQQDILLEEVCAWATCVTRASGCCSRYTREESLLLTPLVTSRKSPSNWEFQEKKMVA
ncbi:molybdopterin cofactor-binding domain-containing protein [Escherichia coli]